MDLVTAGLVLLVVGIVVGGWLYSKEIDSKKPLPPPAPPKMPESPKSDIAIAISALEDELCRLHDRLEDSGYPNEVDMALVEAMSNIHNRIAELAKSKT